MATPADELRTAAVKLRALLADVDRDISQNPYWAAGDHPPHAYTNLYARGVDAGLGGPAGAYAAAMHPGVGAALAAWLYRVAHGWDSLTAAAAAVLDPSNPAHTEPARLLNEGPYDSREALAIARLINGSTT